MVAAGSSSYRYCTVSWPDHRNSDILGLHGDLGFRLAKTLRRKASKTVNHQPPVANLSFGAVDPSPSADLEIQCLSTIPATEGADGRREKRRSVRSCSKLKKLSPRAFFRRHTEWLTTRVISFRLPHLRSFLMNDNERLQVALLKRRPIISLYGDVTPRGT
jgi:hypothetical protein